MTNGENSIQNLDSGQTSTTNPNDNTEQVNQIPYIPPQDRAIIENDSKPANMEKK